MRSSHLAAFTLTLALYACLALTGCGKGDGGSSSTGGTKPTPSGGGHDHDHDHGHDHKHAYAFVTNGVADFWKIGEAGAQQAAKDLGVEVTVIMPSSITDQTRKLEDLLTRGTDGIAISPINPAAQGEILKAAADKTNLITHDSDAPDSPRLVYVGVDNYEAGLKCGEMTRKALPDGGKIMVFIGRLDQDNAQRRRQGTVDAILGRTPDPTRKDEAGATLTSDDGKYVILGTLTDNFDRAKAKANAEDTLTRNPDITAMVGLFEYNPPLIMEALDRAGKLGQVKVVAFDENDLTLQGIKDGTVVGTVVQDPYMYGYKSIEVLHKLNEGDKTVIPQSKFINVPARVIDKANVDEFWADLKKKTGKQ